MFNIAGGFNIGVAFVPPVSIISDFSKVEFELTTDNYVPVYSGRANVETFSFRPIENAELCIVSDNGLLDFDSNDIQRVEISAGESSINSSTAFVEWDGDRLYAKLGQLSGVGEVQLRISIYGTNDDEGTLIAAPGLSASPIAQFFV